MTTSKILCVTVNPAIDISCSAERIQPTLKVRTRNQLQHPGGGGTNVARVIALLGGRPELAYLSGGPTGILYDGLLEPLPIDLHRFAMEGSIRVAFTVHEHATGFEYRFVPEGPDVREEELGALMDFVAAFEGDFIVASGSLPEGAPADLYAQMAGFASRRGAKFVLDTSGEALQETLSNANVFMVKPSLRELETYAGRKLDETAVRDVAAELVSRGVAKHVAVTLGREGALLASEEGILRLPAIHVNVVSAVGAGDSFVGAVVWALAEGHSVEASFRYGMAAGAACAMTPGTELCRKADVMALYAR